MKLLISIILIALIVYAVYIAKYLSPRGKKVCTVVANGSGFRCPSNCWSNNWI